MKVLSNHSKGTLTFNNDVDTSLNITETDSKTVPVSSVTGSHTISSNFNSSESKSANSEKYDINRGML